MFAYQLRIVDESDDRYTNKLLGYIKSENMNPLLKRIILANKRGNEPTELYWSTETQYKLTCGQAFNFVMKYEGGQPYAILDN